MEYKYRKLPPAELPRLSPLSFATYANIFCRDKSNLRYLPQHKTTKTKGPTDAFYRLVQTHSLSESGVLNVIQKERYRKRPTQGAIARGRIEYPAFWG